MKDFFDANKFAMINTYSLLCEDGYINLFNKKKLAYNYSYNGHLSRIGAKLVWDNIGEQIYQFILDNQKPIN